MAMASVQSFPEYTSNSFSLATQCQELTGCGSTLTEELTTPQFASFPSCLTYNSGTVNIDSCPHETNYNIDFRCEMEGVELTDSQSLTITQNALQLTTCTASFTINLGETFSHDLVLDYQQGQPVISNPSFDAFLTGTSTLPSFMSLTSSSTTATIQASPTLCEHAGTYSIEITGQDTDKGSQTVCAFSLTVAQVNTPPSLAAPLIDQSYQILAESYDKTYTLPAFVDDGPIDQIVATFKVDGTAPPAWISLSEGVFTVNTDNSAVLGVKSYNGGFYEHFSIELTLTDSNSCSFPNGVQSYSESFNLSLNTFNHQPQVGSIGSQKAVVSFHEYIDFPPVTDEDIGDSLTYELLNIADLQSITNTVPGITLDLANKRIAVEVDDELNVGTYNLSFKVSDNDSVKQGTLKTNQVEFQLRLTLFNFAPSWQASFDSLNFEMPNFSGKTIILPLCYDQNPTDTLIVSFLYSQDLEKEVASLDFIAEFAIGQRLYMSFQPSQVQQVGDYKVCVTCTDNDSVDMGEIKSVSQCFEFKVKGQNSPPEIVGDLQDVSIKVNETYVYQLPGYTDPDFQDTFEEKITVSGFPLPSFIQKSAGENGSGPRLTIKPSLPSHAGSYNINYLVKDSNSQRGEEGFLSDSASFILNIEKPRVEKGEKEFDPDSYVFESPKSKTTKPIAAIKTITQRGVVVVEWNQKMVASDKALRTSNQRKIIQASILSFSDPEASSNILSFEMTSFTENKMKFKLQFKNPQKVSVRERDILKLQFTESFFLSKESRLKIEENKIIEKSIPWQLDKSMAGQIQFIEENSEATKGFLSALFGMNFFLSFFVSTVLNMLWTLLNSLQLIMTLPLMAVELPYNAFLVSQIFNQVVNFNIFPVAAINGFLFEFEEDEQVKNPYFREYSFENYAMIQNLELLFYIFIAILITGVTLKIFIKFCKKRKEQIRNLIQKLVDFTLRFMIESYLEFLLSALTNIQHLSWTTFGEALSSILAISFTALLLLIPFLIHYYLTLQYREPILKDEKGSVLYSEVTQTSKKAFLFNFYFILRRMTHVLSLCFLYYNTVLQIQAIFAITFITELYIIRNSPFKESYLNKLELVNEFFLHLLSYFCVLFNGLVEDIETNFQLGWCYIYIFCFQVIFNMTCIIYISVHSSKWCQRLRKKKRLRYNRVKRRKFKQKNQKHFLKNQPTSEALKITECKFLDEQRVVEIVQQQLVLRLKSKGKARQKRQSFRKGVKFVAAEQYRTIKKESDIKSKRKKSSIKFLNVQP